MTNPDDITPMTLTDFPGKTAAILWFGGCNLRCPYCYNADLVVNLGNSSVDAYEAIKKRKNMLDGVVLSGGECTLVEDLEDICKAIKDMGLLVKVDTNGSNPSVILNLAEQKLVDYVALDCKAPKHKYWRTVNGFLLWPLFVETLQILQKSGIEYEVRTTVHPSLLSTEDVKEMILSVREKGYTNTYFLQAFQNTAPTLGNMKTPGRQFDFDAITQSMKDVAVRGL